MTYLLGLLVSLVLIGGIVSEVYQRSTVDVDAVCTGKNPPDFYFNCY